MVWAELQWNPSLLVSPWNSRQLNEIQRTLLRNRGIEQHERIACDYSKKNATLEIRTEITLQEPTSLRNSQCVRCVRWSTHGCHAGSYFRGGRHSLRAWSIRIWHFFAWWIPVSTPKSSDYLNERRANSFWAEFIWKWKCVLESPWDVERRFSWVMECLDFEYLSSTHKYPELSDERGCVFQWAILRHRKRHHLWGIMQ